MKTINKYITEKLKINKNKIGKGPELTLFPETPDEFRFLVDLEMRENGNECSLNHIDVSKLDDMTRLFSYELSNFNGDISEWDVSHVTNMAYMFKNSKFNKDISNWDVSNVKDMTEMFNNSKFNGDISRWDVSNVEDMDMMFFKSKFNKDISSWNVSKVKNMESMFDRSKFNQDISIWKINPDCKTRDMFNKCLIKDKYKPFKNSERIN